MSWTPNDWGVYFSVLSSFLFFLLFYSIFLFCLFFFFFLPQSTLDSMLGALLTL